jgi:hypothetical protein
LKISAEEITEALFIGRHRVAWRKISTSLDYILSEMESTPLSKTAFCGACGFLMLLISKISPLYYIMEY